MTLRLALCDCQQAIYERENKFDMENPDVVLTQAYEDQMKRIREALQDRYLNKVAEATGLHRNTLVNIKNGKIDRASPTTIKKLSDYLFPESAAAPAGQVEESPAA